MCHVNLEKADYFNTKNLALVNPDLCSVNTNII